jgi:hypothetical protein
MRKIDPDYWKYGCVMVGLIAGYTIALATEQQGFPYPGMLYRMAWVMVAGLLGALAYSIFKRRNSN